MPRHRLWDRLKKARLIQLLALYLGASWLVLQVVALFVSNLGLPDWAFPAAVLLLLVGLVVVLATAWVQSHPLTESRAAAEEVPDSWELELSEMGASLKRGEVPHLTWGRAVMGGVLAFSLLFGFAGLYVVLQDRGRSFTPTPAVAGTAAPGVAVLPFAVRGTGLDASVWGEGMVNLLSFGLDGAGGLRAIDSRTVLARWGEAGADDGPLDLAGSLAVARATGAHHAVLGSAVAVGSDVRLAADIHDLRQSEPIGQIQVEGDPDSVQALVDRLAVRVTEELLGPQADRLRMDLARTTTRSLPALKAYLDGETAYRHSDFDGAIRALERAVEFDSTFALAHARLAQAHGWVGDRGSGARVTQHRDAALRFADRLPQRERTLLRAWRAVWEEGKLGWADTLRELTERYPDDPNIWYQYGDAHEHRPLPATKEEEVELFRRALELDPGFAPVWIHYLEGLFFTHPGDSAAVVGEIERFERLAGPEESERRKYRYAAHLAFGTSRTRDAALAALDTVPYDIAIRVRNALGHPRHWEAREELLRLLAARDEPEARERWTTALFELFLDRGRWRAAVELARDGGVAAGPRCFSLGAARDLGIVPEEVRLESIVRRAAEELPPPVRSICPVFFAAVSGDREAVERGIQAIRERGRELAAAGDTSGAAERDTTAAIIGAFALWKRGEPGAALERFDALFGTDAPTPGTAWRGRILLELGRHRAAERELLRHYHEPVVRLHLARAREALGKEEEALEDYRYFVEAFRDADRELEPMVEGARERIRALGGDEGPA